MTPKGLLRLKEASSTLADLAEGSFRTVIADAEVAPENVRRLVLCSGKVYYDLAGHELRREAPWLAIGRVEQLYPFPLTGTAELVRSFPHLEEVVWAQEEPQNMGPWRAIRHRLEESLRPGSSSASRGGRGARARARAIRRRTCASRTESFARL